MPPSKSRPHLVLDLGGVIVDHDNALCLDRLIGLLEKPPTRDELASVVAASGIGNGSIDAAALFELIRQRYGSNSPLEEFLAAWTCHFSLKQDVYQLLQSIKASRPVVLCSNTNAAHWDYLNGLHGLVGLTKKAVLSHECGFEKPMPEIYLKAAAAHDSEPQECLFVDDLTVNIDAAKALGFRTHLFTNYDGFRRLLERD